MHNHPPSNDAQLCTGEVRHTRLRPVRHAFAYRVFFLRLPLRSLQHLRDPFDKLRLFSRNRFNLLSFHDADHGDGKQPPLTWIDSLLHEQDITDADGEIWLQTFPRVLGYVFNPVSFWFCHRRDGTLRALLCQVSNTFGERHCYLLDSGKTIVNGEELEARKVFHVSPFCKVEGNYRFRFLRRAGTQEKTLASISYDDAHGPLLDTSVAGTSAPLGDRAVLAAFFTHPLMTLAIVARIHWQALRLWLRRVPFHSKPAPPSAKVTR